MFNKLPIRQKLLLGYSLVLILSISIGNSLIYLYVRGKITTGLERELNNTTKAIQNLVRTSAAVSIKNHLRAAAEKNVEIIEYFYKQQKMGILSELEAKKRAADILLSQKIGESGYIYCLDSDGNVVVHPRATASRKKFFSASCRKAP